jgi:hypothetical protein
MKTTWISQEIRNTDEAMNNKKAPGEDGITGEIYNYTFKTLPKYLTAMYNGCLKHAIFPTRWKKAKLIPIVKPGKEKSYDVTKYRPISLLNVGGKVLEKLLINRINHHVFTKNQFGFTPQKSTTDAAMALKDFVQEGFRSGEVAVLVSLDAEGAFNSAWWPSIIKSLKDSGCLRNLINLTRSYFTNHLVSLQTKNVRIEAVSTRACPQGSCSGPGLWNIQYNSLLNLNYMTRTKTIAFADDLILITRGKSEKQRTWRILK